MTKGYPSAGATLRAGAIADEILLFSRLPQALAAGLLTLNANKDWPSSVALTAQFNYGLGYERAILVGFVRTNNQLEKSRSFLPSKTPSTNEGGTGLLLLNEISWGGASGSQNWHSAELNTYRVSGSAHQLAMAKERERGMRRQCMWALVLLRK